MKQKILIVGSSNVDFVVGVREMPLPGETLMGSSFDNVPGGKGANQACACGRLGGESVFLSCVGKNAQGDMLLESLRGAHGYEPDACLGGGAYGHGLHHRKRCR